jgi:hypothetical protein
VDNVLQNLERPRKQQTCDGSEKLQFPPFCLAVAHFSSSEYALMFQTWGIFGMAAQMVRFNLAAASLFALLSSKGFAWGSLGHDLVTRAAVHLLEEKSKYDGKCTVPFLAKQVMLGHLANVPDIHWKGMAKELTEVGNPTHFIDWEILSAQPSIKNDVIRGPREFHEAVAQAVTACAPGEKARFCPNHGITSEDAPKLLGSAPWRVEQFWNAMAASMKSLTAPELPQNERERLTNEMLKNAGLLSHFVADLAMPLHTTKDYDGKDTHQEGLHGFFEVDIIDALGPDLEGQVVAYAKKQQPFKKQILAPLHEIPVPKPLDLAKALSIAAFSKIGVLKDIDRAHGIVKASGKNSDRVIRKPARDVAKDYRELAVSQMALAADTLAELWLAAWQQAGKPDLSEFRSYYFWFTPDFVPPDYIKQAAETPK